MADKPEKTSRQPEYSLNCLNKTTEAKGRIGAAWLNDDGSIRIVIDPFVVLPPVGEIVLTLFKNKPYTQSKPPGRSNSEQLERAERGTPEDNEDGF